MRAVTIDSDLATLFTFTPGKPPITPIEGYRVSLIRWEPPGPRRATADLADVRGSR